MLKKITVIMMDKTGKNKNRILIFLICIIVLLSVLAFFISINKSFDHDEFEHIHSGWYVKNGYIPYLDFYQCHNPLFWYMMAPFMYIFGDSIETVILLRIIMFMLTLGIAFFTYLIAEKTVKSKEAGLLAVVLLLSTVLFVEKSIEIRPDVPQVFFSLISVYFFINFFQSNKDRDMIYAGLSASISFLFLQKMIFLLIAFSLVFIYKLFERKIRIKPVAYFAGFFLLPMSFFLGYLTVSGALNDYIVTNWILHIGGFDDPDLQQGFSPFFNFKFTLIQNTLFWLLTAVSVSYIFLNKEVESEIKTAAFIGSFLLFSLVLVFVPHKQYFLLSIPLLCVVTGYFIMLIFDKFELKNTSRVILTILIIILPVYYMFSMGAEKNRKQLATANYVIQNTEDSDLVYDGGARYNLFRRDLHYFWYSAEKKKLLGMLSKLVTKVGDYDVCKLIVTKKPKFMLAFGLPDKGCQGLGKFYKETEYPGLYIRR